MRPTGICFQIDNEVTPGYISIVNCSWIKKHVLQSSKFKCIHNFYTVNIIYVCTVFKTHNAQVYMYFSIYVKRENKLPPSFFPLLLPICRLSTVAELHTLIAHVLEWKCFAHSAIQWDKRCGKVTKICEKANTKAHTYTHVHVNREKVKKSYNSSVKENKQNKLKERKKKTAENKITKKKVQQ